MKAKPKQSKAFKKMKAALAEAEKKLADAQSETQNLATENEGLRSGLAGAHEELNAYYDAEDGIANAVSVQDQHVDDEQHLGTDPDDEDVFSDTPEAKAHREKIKRDTEKAALKAQKTAEAAAKTPEAVKAKAAAEAKAAKATKAAAAAADALKAAKAKADREKAREASDNQLLDARMKKLEYEKRRRELENEFGLDGKKSKAKMKKGEETPTGSDESDSSTNTDSSDDSEGRSKSKKKRGKKGDSDSGEDSSNSGGSEKKKKMKAWKRALGYVNRQHPRFEKEERKSWEKRGEHRKEASLIYGPKNRIFGVTCRVCLKALANIETLGGSHVPLKQMVTSLRATFGANIDRIVEVCAQMKRPGPFPNKHGLTVATDGRYVAILAAIHRCQVAAVHVRTVAQIYFAINACPSQWTPKMGDLESSVIETPVTATPLGYTHCEYTARASDLLRPETTAALPRAVPRNAPGTGPPRGPPPRNGSAPSAPSTHLQGTPPAPVTMLATGVPLRSCNNCGGTDGHWGKECIRTCTLAACKTAAPSGVTHTGKDCPVRKQR